MVCNCVYCRHVFHPSWDICWSNIHRFKRNCNVHIFGNKCFHYNNCCNNQPYAKPWKITPIFANKTSNLGFSTWTNEILGSIWQVCTKFTKFTKLKSVKCQKVHIFISFPSSKKCYLSTLIDGQFCYSFFKDWKL